MKNAELKVVLLSNNDVIATSSSVVVLSGFGDGSKNNGLIKLGNATIYTGVGTTSGNRGEKIGAATDVLNAMYSPVDFYVSGGTQFYIDESTFKTLQALIIADLNDPDDSNDAYNTSFCWDAENTCFRKVN